MYSNLWNQTEPPILAEALAVKKEKKIKHQKFLIIRVSLDVTH